MRVKEILRQLTHDPDSLCHPTEMLRFRGMWPWRRKKPIPEGFPEGFKVHRIGISAAIAVSELPAGDIAKILS